MKVEIREDGTLIVNSENELESYALKVWNENFYQGNNESMLFINTCKVENRNIEAGDN